MIYSFSAPTVIMVVRNSAHGGQLSSWPPKRKRSYILADGNSQLKPDRHHCASAAAASLPVTICKVLDKAIDKFMDPPELRPSVDPMYVLSGNFAPVDELPPTSCPVVRGIIPRCLAGGVYIRNGPNPQHRLPGRTHHLFDGDGMLHSILLPAPSAPPLPSSSSSEPVFCSRYVRTYKYLLESEVGAPVIPNFFGGFQGMAGLARAMVTSARALTGQINMNKGFGVANTSVAFFREGLYALCESDLPYAMCVNPATGEVTTLGRCNFDGHLAIGMTAHPKKDPLTGELFAFRYSILQPHVTYFWFDEAGNKAPDVPIFSLQKPSVLHDFAITERYAIFPQSQLVMKPMDMVVRGSSLVGLDHTTVPRIGVLPRYATDDSEMRWFEVPGFNMLHTANAWEEEVNGGCGGNGEEIVLVATNVLSIHRMLGDMGLMQTCIEMVRINLRTNTVSRVALSPVSLEFGMINQGYIGRRSRYGYFGLSGPLPRISGIRKLDFELVGTGGDCTVARRDFGPGCYAGEPFFVPDKVDGDGNEDDGYVVCYTHHEDTGESRFVVMDARSATLEVVAEVQLPGRVPYGFHGLFLTQAELLALQHKACIP